jgi:hypothetical protein
MMSKSLKIYGIILLGCAAVQVICAVLDWSLLGTTHLSCHLNALLAWALVLYNWYLARHFARCNAENEESFNTVMEEYDAVQSRHTAQAKVINSLKDEISALRFHIRLMNEGKIPMSSKPDEPYNIIKPAAPKKKPSSSSRPKSNAKTQPSKEGEPKK